MHVDTIELRQPTDTTDELRAWTRPTAAAFGEVFSDAEFEYERLQWEVDHVLTVRSGR